MTGATEPNRSRCRRLAVVLSGCLLAAGCAAASGGGVAPRVDPVQPDSGDDGLETLLELPVGRPLTAGFVIVDGVYNTELMAPWDVFEHARYHTGGRPAIEVVAISPDGEPVTTAEGLRILADHGFADAPPIDILVVPSAEGSRDRDLQNEALVGFVRERGRQARFVVSLCWGAFVLAQAGLLEDRACTTFPADYQRFAESFPAARLHINVSYVHDGRLLTSEGGARSYHAALYLIDLLYGEEVAAGIGRGLLIRWPPEPAQEVSAIVDPRLRRSR